MKTTFTKILTVLSIGIISIASFCSSPVFANSDSICNNANVTEEVKAAAGCTAAQNSLVPLIQNILNAVIAVAGIVAVIFIIKGGFEYMTSSGETTKIQKAKQTILYAVIGLIICALSFAIVNFAIGALDSASTGGGSTSIN